MPCCGGQAFPYLGREVAHRGDVGACPEPPRQVADVVDAAGGGEANGQVKGLPTDGARPFRLVLGGVGGGEQGKIEGPPTDVAAVHVQGSPRIPGGVAGFAEVAEALGHAGCQLCHVEVGQPGGVVFLGSAVERAFSRGEGHAAGTRVVAGRVPVCFHDQAFGEQCR